jgi:hypothetical protein
MRRLPCGFKQPREIRAEVMAQLQFYIRRVFEKRLELDALPQDDAHRPFGYHADGTLLANNAI